jgi:hypothetical protein
LVATFDSGEEKRKGARLESEAAPSQRAGCCMIKSEFDVKFYGEGKMHT